jgi:hypothetical protein
LPERLVALATLYGVESLLGAGAATAADSASAA